MRAPALPPASPPCARPPIRRSVHLLPAVLTALALCAIVAPPAAYAVPFASREVHGPLFSSGAASRRFALFSAAAPANPDALQDPRPFPDHGSDPRSTDPLERPARPGNPGTAAGPAIPDGPVALTRRVGHDLLDLAKSPAHLSARGWGKLAGGALLIGLAHLADDDVRSNVLSESPDSRSWAESIRPLGQEGGLGLALLAWGAGKASGHNGLSAIGEDGLEATVVAAGVVAPLLKLAVGRDRPRSGQPNESFSGHGESFPSGEVTQAFAMASVVAAHSRRPWVDALAWGAASTVAWERLRLDAHWASDVVGGALIGAGIGRWVVRRNHPRLTERSPGDRLSAWNDWNLTPLLGKKSFGLGFRVTF